MTLKAVLSVSEAREVLKEGMEVRTNGNHSRVLTAGQFVQGKVHGIGEYGFMINRKGYDQHPDIHTTTTVESYSVLFNCGGWVEILEPLSKSKKGRFECLEITL